MFSQQLNHRLGPEDNSFLVYDTETTPMNIGAVSVLEGDIEFDRFVENIQSKIHLIPRYQQLVVSAPFGIGRPTWEFDPSFDVSRHVRELVLEPPGTLDQLFALPDAVAKRRSRRVVMVLDEFQEIVAIAPDLPARMRAVFQFQPEVAHVYLGSRQHLLRRVFTDANQPLYNSAKVMALGPIVPEVFAAFINERYSASGKTITPEATTALLGYTNGHPHDTQKLASFTWALVPDGAAATPETVEAAVGQILETDTARYTELWDSLATNQRRLLEALARADRPANPLTDAFRRAHRLGTYASADRALDALFERGYVERVARDAVVIPDVFLRLWLQEEPATSIVSLVCGTCGEGFAVPVWHCPDCDHHSHQDDPECGNCHRPRPSPAARRAEYGGESDVRAVSRDGLQR